MDNDLISRSGKSLTTILVTHKNFFRIAGNSY